MGLLKSRFLAATAIASAVQWLVLGAVSGVVVARWLRPMLTSDSDPGALQTSVRHVA